jgi:methionine-R-sulfoxide reductase
MANKPYNSEYNQSTGINSNQMKKLLFFYLGSLLLWSCEGNTQNQVKQGPPLQTKTMNDNTPVQKSDEEWKQILSPDQYHVLREKGTESPFSGKLLENKEKGVYICAACGNELFTSDMKFDSHCGWPSFDREIAGGKIKIHRDTSLGMVRTEIMCARCGSHLGHIFDDGPTATGQRYCVNSLSLDFKKEDQKK